MKHSIQFITCAAALAILSGCGGGGSNTGGPSVWQGSWSGAFSENTVGQNGTIAFNVGSDGKVSGSGTNTTTSKNFNLSGNINNDGSITWIVSGDEAGTISGQVTKSTIGHMTGVVSFTQGIQPPINMSVDLLPN